MKDLDERGFWGGGGVDLESAVIKEISFHYCGQENQNGTFPFSINGSNYIKESCLMTSRKNKDFLSFWWNPFR